MKRIVQVQVVIKVADEVDGELGDISEVGFTITAAEWKRGWDWEQALRTALGEIQASA